MSERRVDVFFYGLFMDGDVLKKNGVDAVNSRQAFVDNFELVIGRRATLVATPGARAYGMVMSLTHAEIDSLYSGPGLEDYRPEALLAHSLDGQKYPALSYNLLQAPASDEKNVEYAKRLAEALKKLDFPADYIASIK